ncbi:Oidioi.mRNA.OKI2018_I69.XSR.g15504.t1.cds [Oikopleura dioica]|uniref:Oidioi.mRNA.OKI2018_I69.XSR.g15504.t1.cds n=1 Tax=Oikopleura dioica TaxID=34765 RepID=A0ABN7SH47_OIKDI|nr:Oidioi.mRNA.OKI2018_I69.XSR.g15504.t1.cds [Oikopleura dioica]
MSEMGRKMFKRKTQKKCEMVNQGVPAVIWLKEGIRKVELALRELNQEAQHLVELQKATEAQEARDAARRARKRKGDAEDQRKCKSTTPMEEQSETPKDVLENPQNLNENPEKVEKEPYDPNRPKTPQQKVFLYIAFVIYFIIPCLLVITAIGYTALKDQPRLPDNTDSSVSEDIYLKCFLYSRNAEIPGLEQEDKFMCSMYPLYKIVK